MTVGDDPHSRAGDAVHQNRPVEAQYVRQGRRGVHVLVILAVSLSLAVLLVWGAWALFFSAPLQSTEVHNARQPSDAAVFEEDVTRAPVQTPEQDPTAAARGSTAASQGPSLAE